MFIFSAVSDYLSCGYEATKELCDADDAQFFELYSYKMIKPMTSAYQCEIGIVGWTTRTKVQISANCSLLQLALRLDNTNILWG